MQPIKDNSGGAGPWANDDLSKTSASEVGVGADTELPDPVRFVTGVAKLIWTRRAYVKTHQLTDSTEPAIFVLAPNVNGERLPSSPKRMPRLRSGIEALTNRLWFVSSAVVSGKFIDLPTQSTSELFDFVIDDLGLGGVPTVFYDPRVVPASLSFYPNGLNEEENIDELSLEKADVSLEKVFEIIDHIHENHLITPEAQADVGKLWKDKKKGWPTKLAEETVQFYLQVGLSTAFPTCTIRSEQTQVSGRLDLEIEESDFLTPSFVTRHVLLELKVLRSYGSTGTPESAQQVHDWITKGLEQASTYRDERKVLKSALCCFDMRITDTGDACFDHINDNASKLSVVLKRWYLFSTSAALRSSRTTRQLGA